MDDSPDYDELRQFVRAEFEAWTVGDRILLTQDPSLDFVHEILSSNKQNPQIAGIQLDRLQHANLLYMMRNSLVHEVRYPGHDLETGDANYPYYSYVFGYWSNNRESQSWQLQYPLNFVSALARVTIRNLRAHLEAEGIDPYSGMSERDYWYQRLNHGMDV